VVPIHWKMVSMAIGLRRIYSKSAANVVDAITNILLRYVFYYFVQFNVVS
jgi:hypothetical protein